MSFVTVFRVFAHASLLSLWSVAVKAAPVHCSKPIASTGALARLDRLESSKLKEDPGVRVLRDGRPILAESCMPLRRGDLLETGPKLPVLVQFAEGLVLLMPNTKVRIGSIWTFFGEVFSFGHVKLQDRYVTAGAEGTSYVFHSDAKGTTVTVLQGHVRVTPEKQPTGTQRLESGQRVQVSPNAGSTVTRLSAAEVSHELQSYQALTGYSAAELALVERGFTQPVEPAPNTPSTPAEGSAGSAGDAPIASVPVQPSNAATASVAASSPSAAASAAIGMGRLRNTASVLVEGSFSFGSDDTPIEIGAGSLALAWSRRIIPLGSLQFGSRVLGGATFGRYRSPMFDPNSEGREEAALAGTARLPFHGAFAQLDAELGGNWGVVNVVGSLGLRGGWSHVQDVKDKADHFVWGPATSVRSEYPFAPGVLGLFEIEFWFQRTPVAACPIGCNEAAEPRSAVWQAWLGFAIGVGVDL